MKIEPRLTFKQAIINCLKNYKKTNGRARRSEYWNFSLLFSLVFIIFEIVIINFINYIEIIISFISIIFIFTLIPFTTALIRRLHDTGKSGFYLLITFVPIIGQFYLFFWLIQDSDQKSNKYGPSPKYSFIDSGNPLMNIGQVGQINMIPNMQMQMNNQNINQNQVMQINAFPQMINQQGMQVAYPANIFNSNNYNIYRINQPLMPPLVINENYEPGIYQNI